MENITQFKARLTASGNSRYILVPQKEREYEGLNDDDWILVTIKKIAKPVEEISKSES